MSSLRNFKRRLLLLTVLVALGIIFSYFFYSLSSTFKIIPIMSFTATARPRVTLRQGTVIGSKLLKSAGGKFPVPLEQFLGIPYALSTSGERRWKPAVPIGKGDGEFDAGKWGHSCPAGFPDVAGWGEDCLNLNLYRPANRPKEKKLPVLVYFHGGSFNVGFGHMRYIDSLVAWSGRPMIGVSFNYRLAAFGFLAGKAAKEEGAVNLGLKDQGVLLQWVKDNILAFGGDPDDVTIMGSSAGAHSVGHHVLHNPKDSPLFHKAIIESGGATARACLPYDNAIHETQFKEFLTHLGLLSTPSDKLFRVLRTLPMSQIKSASEKVWEKYSPSLRWPFQPVIDGEGGFIPVAPIKKWREGTWTPVPILTGYNTNEGAVFVDHTVSTDDEFISFFRTLLPKFTSDDLDTLSSTYPDPLTTPSSPYTERRKFGGIGPQFLRLEQAYGHFAYVNPVRQTAKFASKNSDVWLYHFAVNSSNEGGADHGSHDSFATYSQEIRDRSQSLREISGKMHAYWTSFITTGDPNTEPGLWEERATWPKFEARGDNGTKWGRVAVFGEGNNEGAGGKEKGKAVQIVEDTWRREECEFWDKRTELFES